MSRLRSAWRVLLSGTGWLLHWWPGALLALVLALALGWVGWANSEGSFQQAWRWAERWADQPAGSAGQLSVRFDARTPPSRLSEGGQIAYLSWHKDGLSIEAEDVRFEWSPRWWLSLLHGDGVQVQALRVARLSVRDQRPATPTEPLRQLIWPLPISVPFELNQLEYQGATQVTLDALRGHYQHDRAGHHRLRLDELALAQGRYSGELELDGHAPMTLAARLQGLLQLPQWSTHTLQAAAQLQGTLAGPQAQLQLTGQLHNDQPLPGSPPAPEARVEAELRPWDGQPVHRADLTVTHLDLAALWPGAPRTALSGRVQATPTDRHWTAEADLNNRLAGPWDRHRLPLESLHAKVLQTDARQWTLTQLTAQVGQGLLKGQGVLHSGTASGDIQADGQLTWTGLNPAALLSTLPSAPLNLSAEASSHPTQGNRLSLNARPSSGQGTGHPLALRLADLQGHWQGSQWTLERLRAEWPQAQLSVQGRWDATRMRGESQGSITAPGTHAAWRADLGPDTGAAQLDLQVPESDRLLPWLQRVTAAASPGTTWPNGWAARGEGGLHIDWQGGWRQARRWWQTSDRAQPTEDTWAMVRRLANQPALPLTLELRLPTLSQTGGGQTSTANAWRIALTGGGGRWQLSHQGQLMHQGHNLQLDHAWTLSPDTNGPRLEAVRWQADVQLAQMPAAWARWQLQLNEPLVLRWLAEGAMLAPGSLKLNTPGPGATALALRWGSSHWFTTGADAGLSTGGSLDGLPLRWLDQLTRSDERPDGLLAEARLQGDMTFDARWSLRLPLTGTDGARGELNIERRSGDLALKAEPETPGSGPLAAGVSQALLSLQLTGADLGARLLWDSQRAGHVDARVRTQWVGGLAQPEWPADAPLDGSIKTSLPQVGLWSVLAPPGWRMSGSLQADAELRGNRANPQWSGQLRGDGLALRSLVEGIEFAGGELRASLRGEELLIERLLIAGPGGAATGGQLRASGSASWAAVTAADGRRQRQPLLQLQAQAERLRVSVRADRRLTVSGEIQARLQGKDLQLRGGLSVDQAAFVLPDEQTPRLGEDVVVRGRTAPNGPTGNGARVVPDVLLELRLGEQFQVRGHGLDTRLAGELSLRSTATQPSPRLLGEVRTVRGTYRAYGQRLDIEQGVVRFAGPYDNPALDVLAIRPFTSQRVGVQIRGTAQAPQVRLYADPDLPDSEKLAWLVLGRSASGGGAEAAVLQQAAIALLSGGSGASPLDGLFGLDEISLRGAGKTTTNTSGETVSGATVTLGKRLSNRLYVAYERSLASTLGTLSLFYDVSRRLTLRARTGEDNAVDLIFTLPYD